MVYSYTVVINNLYSYLHVIIPSVYTPVGRHYPQFSFLSFSLQLEVADFLYSAQLFE